ncbi:3-oxoacyl-[acyl-carrier-protein] reductase [Streptomyces sp. P38-E01]|uniref:3-oxoacyl-[acyl-carrier-protein] reductase n=1 Tax=Streptomyces tardus TaxID=2780544 RepID=A0A949N7U6_9ACTN|nr:3-oxoacyl-[acyl-carrier-protein] reductase [Streptomyces tardus]MBU7597318.1 3-oxoacyl-[acyl-carrier-protein] reductase [Streptomyces tardus]
MTENAAPVALVSGGSRGIGRAVVLRLAAEGYDVSFCYQSNEQAALELEKEAGELGRRVLSVKVDVTSSASVKEWVARTESELGPVDVAVNSAGITRDNPLVLMSDEEWHSVLDTNLDGVYHVSRSVIFEMMKRKSGTIINISSIAGVYGNPTQSNYSASKAGIIGFTKALAKEVGRYNIRANVVAPGYIETDMTAELTDKVKKEAAKQVPLRRFGQVEEVADLVAFLAGERAAYITGSVFQIDGGMTV